MGAVRKQLGGKRMVKGLTMPLWKQPDCGSSQVPICRHTAENYQEEGEFHTQWRAVTSLRLWRHRGIACSWSVSIDGHRLSIIFEKSGVSQKFPMSKKRQMSHPSSRRARRGIWGITSQQASHQVWENYWTNHPQCHFLSTLRLAGISIIDLTQANHAWLTQLLSQRTRSAPSGRALDFFHCDFSKTFDTLS